MVNQERSTLFVPVTCKCGRSLRAKSEQVGTEVRCWDCHQMVFVPIPRQGKRVAREFSEGALVAIEGPELNSLLVGCLVVTAALAVPEFGIWFAVIALTMGASAYGEIIRRVSRGRPGPTGRGWLISLVPDSVPKALAGLAMAAGTVVPLWFLNSGWHQSPHWNGTGRAIATTTWVVLPLVMMMLYGRNEDDSPLGVRKCSRFLLRHPMATLLALSVVPMTVALMEVAIGLFLYFPGNLPFFALDFMPMPTKPEPPVIFEGVPHYRLLDYRNYPPSNFIAGYFQGLRDGYSFVGAIPASLPRSTRAGLNGVAIGLDWPLYVVARVLLTMLVVICLLTAFAIQARWLGSIPALGKRRPA